jgi:hypothetical protein
LGHGVFTLKHTFDNNYGGRNSKERTDNLMDYSQGTELGAFQWNVMSNVALINRFDRDEEGQQQRIGDSRWIAQMIENIRCNRQNNNNNMSVAGMESSRRNAPSLNGHSFNDGVNYAGAAIWVREVIGDNVDISNIRIESENRIIIGVRPNAITLEITTPHGSRAHSAVELTGFLHQYLTADRNIFEQQSQRAIANALAEGLSPETVLFNISNLHQCVLLQLNNEQRIRILNIINQSGRNEETTVLRILNSIDSDSEGFYEHVNSNPYVLEDILRRIRVNSSNAQKIIEALFVISAPHWNEDDLKATDYFLAGAKDIFTGRSDDDDQVLFNKLGRGASVFYGERNIVRGVGVLERGVYRFGSEMIANGLSIPLTQIVHIDKKALEPVIIIFENGSEQIVPAIVAKWYLVQTGISDMRVLADLASIVMLPQILIKAATWARWTNVFRGSVPQGARQLDNVLISELRAANVRFTEADLLWIFRNNEGRIIFLERGNANAGLEHILAHRAEFLTKGIREYDIPNFIMQALRENRIVGYQGAGTDRPIYELMFQGNRQRVAITTGSNGFVVGANPVSL